MNYSVSSILYLFSSFGILALSYGISLLKAPGTQFPLFFALYASGMLCCVLAWCFRPRQIRARSFAFIAIIAICSRSTLLEMEMSDDVYRYAWEGYVLKQGLNPYQTTPEDPRLQSLKDSGLRSPNHPNMGAIYPPLALFFHQLVVEVFERSQYTDLRSELEMGKGEGGKVAELRIPPSSSGLTRESINTHVIKDLYLYFKFAYLLFDLLTIFLLILLLKRRRQDPGHVLLYAYNPVILYAFAGQAHLDSLMIFTLVLALYFFETKRYCWMWISLGLSIASKGPAILAIGALLNRSTLRYSFVLPLLLLLLYFPFLDAPGSLFSSLSSFAWRMDYNGSIFPLLKMLTGLSNPAASAVLMFLGAGILVWVYLCIGDPPRCIFIVFTVFLLLAPTVHFWYLSWIIPFLCFHRSGPVMLWCGLSGLWFAVLEGIHYRNTFEHYPRMVVLQYLPVYLYFLMNWFGVGRRKERITDTEVAAEEIAARNREGDGFQTDLKSFPTLSIIIPVLNEEVNLEILLKQIKNLKHQPLEIIVVDGGSSDHSVQVARNAEVTVFTGLRGRGRQIVQGVQRSKGEGVLVLHADCRIEVDVVRGVCEALKETEVLGGCIGNRYDEPKGGQWIIYILNVFRARVLGMSFGDQGQFFRSEMIKTKRWNLEMPLMEDVELSLCFWETPGTVAYLGGGVVSSVRRWKGSNRLYNAMEIIGFVFLYCFLRRIKGRVETESLYRKYYRI